MSVNKKTTIIYAESYVQFWESVLNQLRVDGINTPWTHPVKYTNEGGMNSNADEYGSKKNQINGKNALWKSHDDSIFEHTILFKTQESKQMFTHPPFPLFILAFVLPFGRWFLDGSLMISCAFCKFPDVFSVLIYTMALYCGSIWFLNQSSYFSKH